MRDAATAQDAAQESLVRIWKALPRYDGRASLSAWIYTITRNHCLTTLGRRRESQSLSHPDVKAEVEAVSAEPSELEGQSALLRALVDTLPERYRRTLTLYYDEERFIAEVAIMLAMPEGTVKTILHRARAALLEQLRRRGLDSPGSWLETGA
jgi:RNA polymerase sigma-70 factor (ECF subfamily)